jgi:transposase, IS5 family
MFRTIGDQPSLWESLLPGEVLRLPEELARVDALLDDPVFFATFACYFDPLTGRPGAPAECYVRLMFLKFRYRITPLAATLAPGERPCGPRLVAVRDWPDCSDLRGRLCWNRM